MTPHIRLIQAQDDEKICRIIQQVGAEFGAIGEGFGPSDPEVLAMSQHYPASQRSAYFVALLDGNVVGGGGIAPFHNKQTVCELRKLFLLPESRGKGLGKALTEACIGFARAQGFEQCYLDTLENMDAAIGLYEKIGFVHLEQALDGTIHDGCDVWMLLDL